MRLTLSFLLAPWLFSPLVTNADSVQITARNGVNLRSSSGSVIGGIPRGARVEVERQSGNYLYVKYKGKRGRIYRKFASGTSVSESAPLSETATQSKSFVKPYDNWVPSERKTVAPYDNGIPAQPRNSFTSQSSGPAPQSTSGRPGTKHYNPAAASSSNCGDIVVDCRSMTISFSGMSIPSADAVIDCGYGAKTKNGYGRVGRETGGERVPHAVDIQMPGMGTPAGGKWFHVPWWKPGMRPNGANDSLGCIHVSPFVLSHLKSCEGSRLTIQNASGSAARGKSSSQQSETAR